MISRIDIPEKYKNRFLKEDYFDFKNNRLIMLWGGNGVGKSSLLELISQNKEQKIYYWVASKDAPLRNGNEVGLENILNFSLLYDSKISSEGQNITVTFSQHLNEVPDDTEILLIDELDSGLSAEHIHICMSILSDWLKEHKKTQCFLSINNYHWIYMFKTVYRMDIGEFCDINNYEDYWDMTWKIANKVIEKESKRDDY